MRIKMSVPEHNRFYNYKDTPFVQKSGFFSKFTENIRAVLKKLI